MAERIERAYNLRRPRWCRGCSTPRIWFAAALRLWETHAGNPQDVPLDAELYVASQPISAGVADPWSELAEPQAGRRYRLRVRGIVRQLRAELKREVSRAERSIRRGRAIRAVLTLKNEQLSPLGCYLVARRAGRPDLASRFAAAAARQHASCPLYKTASLALVPAELYPAEGLAIERHAEAVPRVEKIAVGLN
jgi:hypothetical protein